jgi:2',3'-cyclic-nucleotide 2'-phosphodiesterase (5'-nucleotidase family)
MVDEEAGMHVWKVSPMALRGPAPCLVVAAILFTGFPLSSFARGGNEAELRILYTSSLNGNLDGCACGSVPRSGLVKRAAYLRAHRLPGDILLDAGDIFDAAPDMLLSRHILETYADLGYATVSVADQEFSNGIDNLLELRTMGKLLSNNLSIRNQDRTGTAFSDEPLVLESGRISVGVVALLGPEAFALYSKRLRDRLVLADPVETARRLVGDLRSRGVVCVVLLYHGAVESGTRIISEVIGIDLMIVGHEQRLVAPYKVGSTIVASPGEEGNRVGLIRLQIEPDGTGVSGFTGEFVELSYLRDPDDPAVRTRIETYEKELRARIGEPK